MKSITRRNLFKTSALTGGYFALMGVLSGCAGQAASSAPVASPKPTSNPNAPKVILEIGVKGEELAFDKTTLEAPAGSVITLKFNNTASGMPHNWVLVKPGTEEAVGSDGITAGDKNSYIKPNDPRVIAYTSLAPAKSTVTVTFDAPTLGDYPYICTFPGHNYLMKGVLKIK
jgi:azurin